MSNVKLITVESSSEIMWTNVWRWTNSRKYSLNKICSSPWYFTPLHFHKIIAMILQGYYCLWDIKTCWLTICLPIRQPQSIHKITTSWLGVIIEQCQELLLKSNIVKNKYRNFLLAFSRCHKVYNCACRITDDEIKKLGKVHELQTYILATLRYGCDFKMTAAGPREAWGRCVVEGGKIYWLRCKRMARLSLFRSVLDCRWLLEKWKLEKCFRWPGPITLLLMKNSLFCTTRIDRRIWSCRTIATFRSTWTHPWTKPNARPNFGSKNVMYIAFLMPCSFRTSLFADRNQCAVIEGLCMLQRRLAYPCLYSDLVSRFAKPVPVICMITNCVLDHIYEHHGHRIT